jgi:hypothetical protein
MEHEILIRCDMDGFRATFEPIPWSPVAALKAPTEYIVVEAVRDEQDIPQNLDVWEGVKFFQTLEQ